MAHTRKRHISDLVNSSLRFSPIVGITGHRQVGKTTLITDLANTYYSADDEDSVIQLSASATEAIREVAGPDLVAIDEAQTFPSLFPALKEWVRKHKRPGQFILSGSIRFTSLKSIRESLTGRIVTLELLPLSINEILDAPPPEFLQKLHLKTELHPDHFSSGLEAQERKQRAKAIASYRELGGLPGICFVRNERQRKSRLKTQVDTLLDRDLRIICNTRLGLGELKEIASTLALTQGQPIVLSSLTSGPRKNSRSIAAVLDGLESLFMIRKIPITGDHKGWTFYFEDIAERRFLSDSASENESVTEHLLFSMVKAAFAYHSEYDLKMFQYRTRAGVKVPIAINVRNQITGFIPIQGETPDRQENAAARSFLSIFPSSKVLFCGENSKARYLGPKQGCISFADLSA